MVARRHRRHWPARANAAYPQGPAMRRRRLCPICSWTLLLATRRGPGGGHRLRRRPTAASGPAARERRPSPIQRHPHLIARDPGRPEYPSLNNSGEGAPVHDLLPNGWLRDASADCLGRTATYQCDGVGEVTHAPPILRASTSYTLANQWPLASLTNDEGWSASGRRGQSPVSVPDVLCPRRTPPRVAAPRAAPRPARQADYVRSAGLGTTAPLRPRAPCL